MMFSKQKLFFLALIIKIAFAGEEDLDVKWHSQFYIHCLLAAVCVVMAALAAGLTMGLLSLDALSLKIVQETDVRDCQSMTERKELLEEKKLAAKVLPLVSRHHLLLVTLLLLNSIANEALPLFLDRVVPSWLAIIISVSFVLVFGEIIPSALFTGPNGLKISASLTWIVWMFMTLFFVLAWPISKLLDALLGVDHLGRYNRPELKALIKLHVDNQIGKVSSKYQSPQLSNGDDDEDESSHDGGLSLEEANIVHGALELKSLPAKDTLIPLHKVFMLSTDDLLDTETMARMIASGHSRVPVYEHHPHNIRGLLLVKKLIVLDPEDKRKVGSLGFRLPICVGMDEDLLSILREFMSGKSHLAIVTNKPKTVMSCLRTGAQIPCSVHMAGILTLEDVLERLLKKGIEDETDKYTVGQQMSDANWRKRRITKLKSLAKRTLQDRNDKLSASVGSGIGDFFMEAPAKLKSPRVHDFEEKVANRKLNANESTPLLS
eukprot:TRINITY_DN329_c1_g1_i1.p1 TRINITY_DN329_c1_g1~~TRINITY_DN329_c1_g1_i1.p1  ORF type:complete len:491 (-),score=129.51 TRINITY_DN329_c1_g1_i1:265-1737(-)